MHQALLLIDLQNDFFKRPGLVPALADITGPIVNVLAHARATGMPVAHVRTRIDASGENRMPHWRQSGIRECIAGTAGERPPPAFAELAGEPVFHKQYFSGFSNAGLEEWLHAHEIHEMWVAGVYTHGCIRSTVMDAYEKGYRVTVVDDGVASYDPLHGQVSRDYLNGRAASFVLSKTLLGEGAAEDVHYNPHQPAQEISRVQRCQSGEIQAAVKSALSAGTGWSREEIAARRKIFRRFAEKLHAAESQFVEWMIRDLGKPRRDSIDELHRAHGHLAAALELEQSEEFDSAVTVNYQPHGVVALITPWNNPVAIPIGKLCSALLLGNSVVWKPAFQADSISRGIMSLLHDSGLPSELVQLVNGGPAEVAELVGNTDVAAVSLTGPEQAGEAVSAICRRTGKPLQAELGGNNALLVLADAAWAKHIPTWARMAFGFAGQRCTALRRFVVERSIADIFLSSLAEEVRSLQLFEPSQMDCEVGPLISARQVERVRNEVSSALNRGARRVAGNPGEITADGHYYPPTVLADIEPNDPMVQEELFGPVAIVQTAEDFEHGLALVNGVRQGLLAGIATESDVLRDEFVSRVEAGIVIDGSGMRIHPAAPFGGRKASQIGPPEHGLWDRQFFTRVQTHYREPT
jgi:aldehyde dehydrogenase (NAD+)